jgi:ankyrin repeat protein
MNCRFSRRTFIAWILCLNCGFCLRAAPIHDAAGEGDVEKVRVLLKADPALVDAARDGGVTPLMMAAFGGHLEMAKLLLEKGATVDAKSNEGFTPLMWAARKGQLEIVKLLLQKGANPSYVEAHGLTALWIAEKEGHAEIAEILKKAMQNRTSAPPAPGPDTGFEESLKATAQAR